MIRRKREKILLTKSRNFTDVCMVGNKFKFRDFEELFNKYPEIHKGLKRVTRVQCSWIFTLTIFGNLNEGYPFPQNGCRAITMPWFMSLWYIFFSFQQVTFKLCNFTDFKGFSAMLTDFRYLVQVKSWKTLESLSQCLAASHSKNLNLIKGYYNVSVLSQGGKSR